MRRATRPAWIRPLVFTAVLAVGAPGFSQVDAPYQVRYGANLQLGESHLYIVNTGGNGGVPPYGPGFGANNGGNMCVNLYALDPNEELLSCCSCLVTPNQVVELNVQADIMGNTFTGVQTPSAVIKLVGSTNRGLNVSTCTSAAATVATGSTTNGPVGGFIAFGTTVHPAAGGFAVTETPFLPATLSASELTSLTSRCASILGNGSGYGVCNSCRAGAVEATITTIDFEGLPDSTILINQYPGVTFSNAIVLTAGISLNEFEFPPHSGTNVGADNGTPVAIAFSSPQSTFSGYFTYTSAITVTAYNAANTVVATATSKFNSNPALSGDPGSMPNEFLRVSALGITRITIASSGDFTFDDLSFTQ